MKRFGITVLVTLALSVACTVFIACESARTESHGLENVAYLQISGDSRMYDKVTVVLDGKDSFEAKVNDSRQRSVKNEYSYKIAVGAHDIQVLYRGEVITQKKIFTSANQVKIVEVP